MKTNLRAFTILEVLINIVIMSIIIGMVYFVYSSFSKQIYFYRSDVEEELALSSFCLRLKADFFQAEKIIGTAYSFEVVRYDTNRIQYEVANGFIYRTQAGNRDSLRIDKIEISSKIDPITNENLIRKAQLSTILFEAPMEFTVAKKYPSILDNNTDYGD
ncbi:hypothetical protein FK220_006595 [Flavobacteriaceae bacterium TP-CH-4]|uniref:Prepilin-type N-terminal cleavage/methylation domain-containing protein n=1 Tax=Pelagihabitans pacificus TaxID=2696054 RepID=A0A967AT74_9FLAO|nr:hypothetical protein [Pelagihabitans pacificus]NHF59000.1 hypothetical protein [Pelagihabitans pacificus]